MLYFTIRKAIEGLSIEQKGKLLDAILEYADPDGGGMPDFEGDELLRMAWNFLTPVLDRDDEKYKDISVSRRYANFCGVLKQKGIPKIIREDWEAMGSPTYKEWIKMRAYADTCGHMPAYADTCAPESDSKEDSIPLLQETEKRVSGTGPQAAPDPIPADLLPAFERWISYTAERERPLVRLSRQALAEQIRQYGEKYGPLAVETLVDECITQGQNAIYFDRLDRNPGQYDPWWDTPLTART